MAGKDSLAQLREYAISKGAYTITPQSRHLQDLRAMLEDQKTQRLYGTPWTYAGQQSLGDLGDVFTAMGTCTCNAKAGTSCRCNARCICNTNVGTCDCQARCACNSNCPSRCACNNRCAIGGCQCNEVNCACNAQVGCTCNARCNCNANVGACDCQARCTCNVQNQYDGCGNCPSVANTCPSHVDG